MLFRGYKFASPGALTVLVCFFLPWMMVSCFGQPVAEFSGLDLAMGPEIPGAFGSERGDATPSLFILTAIALIVLLLGLAAASRRNVNLLDQLGILLVGLGPLLMLGINLFGSSERSELAAQGILIEYRIGIWGTLVGLVLIIGGGLMNWMGSAGDSQKGMS